jgi:hypothetical protein
MGRAEAGHPAITVPQLLAALREKRVSVSLADESLAIKGDASVLSEDERAALGARRTDILLFLKAHKLAPMPPLTPSAEAPRPAQAQESWWRWIRQSPVQLSHERVSLVRAFAGVEEAAAREALTQMMARHPVLRSRFSESGGALRLALNPAQDFTIESETVSSADVGLARARDFVAQPLPVDGPWLVKAKIISAPDQVAIALLFAHMIVDGLSAQFLAAELDVRLGGDADAKKALENPPPQFFDFTAAEHTWLEEPAGAALTDYWLNWLAQQSPLSAPSGVLLDWRPGINVSHAFTIPRAGRDAVQALAARHRTSAFFVFLAFYALALARWSGATHFAIRSVGNMRRTQALANMVGFMVCIDPVELCVPAGADFASVLKAVTTDYYNAAMLRLPGFLKFPAQAAHPGVENRKLSESIAATFNFMPARRGDAMKAALTPWPPSIEAVTREPWAALLWPVYLRLADVGEDTKALFQFNEALVTPAEQKALMETFFALIAETV